MITASFVINIALGILNIMAASSGKHGAGPSLVVFVIGLGLITFGIMGLVNG
jgi:hypothetical protein